MLQGLFDCGLLDQERLPDLMLGVSVGALNAAVFAVRPDVPGLAQLDKLWSTAPLQTLFPRWRTFGYLTNREAAHRPQPLRQMIRDNLTIDDLADTKVPLHVLLTDVDRGQEAWFDRGPIVDLLYGSAAIPGVLPPLRLDGHRYIDGGMVNPNPLRRAVELGATKIVLLLCGSLAPFFHSKGRPLSTLLMGYSLTQLALTQRELASQPSSIDIVVLECGAADSVDALDFRYSKLLMGAGRRSVIQAREKLTDLLGQDR
jgi:NTE family protein